MGIKPVQAKVIDSSVFTNILAFAVRSSQGRFIIVRYDRSPSIIVIIVLKQATTSPAHVNLHTPTTTTHPCPLQRKTVIEKGRRDSERKRAGGGAGGGAVAIRHMQRQMLCSAAQNQQKETEKIHTPGSCLVSRLAKALCTI
ncbi:hypothetical protein INR49_030146 [Caranx melampygus]|nr:hypothetical protein INR49_030146 [Caranx melampygus]